MIIGEVLLDNWITLVRIATGLAAILLVVIWVGNAKGGK